VEFIEGFAPGEDVQQEILRRLAEDAGPESPTPQRDATP
jgi:hypothetical protein